MVASPEHVAHGELRHEPPSTLIGEKAAARGLVVKVVRLSRPL
jgi:hypothetical protein